MVKIPEIPGSYRTGDVVNGHVLSPRGHWISLADAASRGVRPRRYLDTQVSTMRNADTPTQVMRGRPQTPVPTAPLAPPQAVYAATSTTTPRAATPPPVVYAAGSTTTPRAPAPPSAVHAAGSTTTPRAPAPPSAAYAAGSTTTPRVAPPPPRPQTRPSVAAPPAALPRVAANPSASRPVPAPPRASNGSSQSSARGKLIGIIVVAFVLFQIISAIARTVGDNFSSDGPAFESETSDMPWATDLEEVDVDVTHHEVWTAQGVGYYLVEVAPTEPLDVPVGVSITVETPDGSGSDSTWAILTGDEPVRVLGELGDADDDADLTGVEVYTDAYAYDGPVRAIEVVDWELLETESPPVVAVHVEDTGDDEGDYGFVVVVVRDDSGQVVAGATEWAWALEEGEGGVVDVTLWDLEELPEGTTIEVTAANV